MVFKPTQRFNYSSIIVESRLKKKDSLYCTRKRLSSRPRRRSISEGRSISAWDAQMPAKTSSKRKSKIQKRKRARARARQPSRHAPEQASTSTEQVHDHAGAGQAALEYLQRWREGEEGEWKFSKSRQTHLLRTWPDPTRLPKEAFELFVSYVATMHPNARQKTLEQARDIASAAEAELKTQQANSHDGGEADAGAHIAILKIRIMRSLKIVSSLGTVNEDESKVELEDDSEEDIVEEGLRSREAMS
eukprot:scaffold8363_cov32-Tisochrysis_lutea.AAC.1